MLEDSQFSLMIFWKQKVSAENPLRKTFTAFLWPTPAWERWRGWGGGGNRGVGG